MYWYMRCALFSFSSHAVCDWCSCHPRTSFLWVASVSISSIWIHTLTTPTACLHGECATAAHCYMLLCHVTRLLECSSQSTSLFILQSLTVRASLQSGVASIADATPFGYEYHYFYGNCILMSHQVLVALRKHGIGSWPNLLLQPMTSVCKMEGRKRSGYPRLTSTIDSAGFSWNQL